MIASDRIIRRSLRFVLEAEGYGVRLYERLSTAIASPATFDCAVVDAKAEDPEWDELMRLGCPVVLLVDHQPETVPTGISLIETPILGRTLVDTVAALLPAPYDRRDPSTT